jgi:pimeloyl-ACP methyl ester carboxylesterase
VLRLPVLFLHARYDTICETVDSSMAQPMRRDCTNLTERILDTGHWMPQERPAEVNAAIEGWLP